MKIKGRRSLISILPAFGVTLIVVSLLLFFYFDQPTLQKDKRQMQSAAYRVEKKIPNLTRKDDGSSNVNVTSGQKHVILLSLARSGSSLTGDILNHGPGVYFVFEPLRHITKVKTAKSERKAKQGDFRSMNAILQKWRADSKCLLEHLFECSFQDLDLTELDAEFLSRYQKSNTLARCVERANSITAAARAKIPTIPNSFDDDDDNDDDLAINIRGDQTIFACLDNAENVCRRSKVRVLKVIRLMLRDYEPMLESDPNLHIVLLVKDPRSSLWSQKVTFQEVGPSQDDSTFIHSQCNVLEDNVNMAVELHTRYPDRLRLMRYETLALEPVEVSKKLYRFLGIEWNDFVEHQITAQTSTGKHMDSLNAQQNAMDRGAKVKDDESNPYAVRRADSLRTARAWRGTITWSFARVVQERCFALMGQLGYPLFHLEQDLRDVSGTDSFIPEQDTAISDGTIWL